MDFLGNVTKGVKGVPVLRLNMVGRSSYYSNVNIFVVTKVRSAYCGAQTVKH